MASSKNATARERTAPARARRAEVTASARESAVPSVRARTPAVQVEAFRASGRVYKWREGEGVVSDRAALEQAARRDELPAVFTRAVVPQMERRGARGLIFEAKRPAGVGEGEMHWVAWRAAGDGWPVWGLYLNARHAEVVGSPAGEGAGAPANDTFVLVAWGDGPALAWVDDRAGARACVRAALREPPPWLARGMRSRDVAFPVRIDLMPSSGPGANTAGCVAVMRASNAPAPAIASREELLDVLVAWKQNRARG